MPLAADFGPDPEAAAKGSAAGWGVGFLRLSPPTSGLGGGGGRSWTGSWLSEPLAADFWPGPGAAAEATGPVPE